MSTDVSKMIELRSMYNGIIQLKYFSNTEMYSKYKKDTKKLQHLKSKHELKLRNQLYSIRDILRLPSTRCELNYKNESIGRFYDVCGDFLF